MALYCKRCGAAYDQDHVSFEMLPVERVRFWDGDGCPTCFGKAVEARPLRAEAMGVMHDLLGNDTDGIAAMMEDFDFLEG